MCWNLCIGYTGPFENLKRCLMCDTPRWSATTIDQPIKVLHSRFPTLPLGTQLQALYWDAMSALQIQYLWDKIQNLLNNLRNSDMGKIPVIKDIAMGWEYLGAVLDGDIKERDIVVMVSLDGAQLYEDKDSDCWIYIWVIMNLSPNQ